MKQYFLIISIILFLIGCTTAVVEDDHSHVDGVADKHDEVVVIDNNVPIENKVVSSVSDNVNVEKTQVVQVSTTKEFTVEAFQFGYAPDVIEVNQGDTVILNAFSRDVGHGLRISEYGINMKLLDNKPITETFVADKKGEFRWFCSVPCGRGHGAMEGLLIVK